ncbi:hypothetical protein H0X06_06590 [Candidatus Dependentiae bacterium]|nr:hypothetical protein [Candidatus Dependentiae bacterium]
MTIFKNSILLALVIGTCFRATAELSPKHKHILQGTAQTAGCVVSTALAAVLTIKHVYDAERRGIKNHLYNKGTWQDLHYMFRWTAWPICCWYVSYRLGKDARKSFRKAFYPKKISENTTIDENNVDAHESTVLDDKNLQNKIV